VRGDVEKQADLIVTVTPEELVPRDHPIRLVKMAPRRSSKKAALRVPRRLKA
jgi:hypothetical protein